MVWKVEMSSHILRNAGKFVSKGKWNRVNSMYRAKDKSKAHTVTAETHTVSPPETVLSNPAEVSPLESAISNPTAA